MRAWITREAIDATALLAEVGTPADGASVLFVGHVRERNEGREVTGIVYDAYVEMAERELAAILDEVAARHGTERLAAVHRIGSLAVGDVSVAIAASGPHRAQAFAACRDVIEEIKRRLPIWKEEHYGDASARWLHGAALPDQGTGPTPDAGHGGARPAVEQGSD